MKKTKHYLITLSGMLLFGLGLYLIKAAGMPDGITKTFPYLLIGIGCGMSGHGMGELLNSKAAERNPWAARQMEIEAKDERNIMIRNMAKGKGYSMMTYVFGALLLAYAFMGASYTIIIPFVIAYLFVQGYALCWQIRISKDL